MKKVYLFSAALLALVFCSANAFAQDWVKLMQDPTVPFNQVQQEFNAYYAQKKSEMEHERLMGHLKFWDRTSRFSNNEQEENEVPGYSIYKRWEWYQQARSQNGERVDPTRTWREMETYLKNYPPQVQAGNWSYIGPPNASNLSGCGRCNFIRVHPTNPNTLYTGSPAGGLWVSTNGGANWTTATDQLPNVIGCTDIAIDANNTQIMYLATGDGDAGDNNSVGLLKSTDGGATWNQTGLVFAVGTYRMISKVLIDPTNSNTILVCTSAGIYRSTDAGVTFTQTLQGTFKDMEFKSGSPSTVYTCGTSFYRSTDNGQTWTQITSGLPAAANVSRMAIAVSPADPNYIYMIVGLPAPNYGTEGFYVSTNSGTTWTKPSTPNIGTQQWYDLAIAMSPTNKQEIILGGQTQFLRSTNGGSSWSNNGNGTHVDYHDIVFTNSTTYYTSSDGGVYKTTNSGSTWTSLDNDMQISEMYGFGQSTSNANLLITGWQDNGTNLYNGSWGATMGGDGMLCFISKSNDNNMWGSQYNGSMNRSTNGGASWSPCGTPAGTAAWVVPWREDPTTANTIYCGFNNVFKSTNGGQTWTQLGNLGIGTTTIGAIAISPANSNVIWAAAGGSLYKTSNGGGTWTTITTLPAGTISYIACHNTDANRAWVTYSGFTNQNKVFQTNDQGATWTNLSGSLPNVPVNCVTYFNGSNDGLYIGTDVGVYYKDASMNVWQPFSGGLPRVIVTQIEVFYAGNTLRCSTYGRGMWESSFYTPGNYAPVANFSADKLIDCPGAAIQFTDYSAGVPTSWQWTFPGGNPSSSTQQNPLVYYNAPGTYSVTLVATNGYGNDTKSVTSYITIANSPNAPPTTTPDSVCSPGGIVNLTATPSAPGTVRWWNAPGGGTMLATGNTYSPNISSTTTYYVDEDFPSGNQTTFGPFDYTIGTGAMFSANDIRGLYFDVLSPVILNTVEVYPNSAGNRTIEIIDPNGNTYIDTTIYLPSSPTSPVVVNLNFKIYPGTGYFIKARGLVDMYRNNAGAVYPYTSPAINITNSNAGSPGYYYFFYNWTYTDIVCNTARTPVTGTVYNCNGVHELFADGDFSVFPNPNNGSFDLSFMTKNKDNFSVKMYDALGRVVYEDKIDNFSGTYQKKIDISGKGKGVYMLVISNGKDESVKKVVTF
jgi:PKD repeat protein